MTLKNLYLIPDSLCCFSLTPVCYDVSSSETSHVLVMIFDFITQGFLKLSGQVAVDWCLQSYQQEIDTSSYKILKCFFTVIRSESHNPPSSLAVSLYPHSMITIITIIITTKILVVPLSTQSTALPPPSSLSSAQNLLLSEYSPGTVSKASHWHLLRTLRQLFWLWKLKQYENQQLVPITCIEIDH